MKLLIKRSHRKTTILGVAEFFVSFQVVLTEIEAKSLIDGNLNEIVVCKKEEQTSIYKINISLGSIQREQVCKFSNALLAEGFCEELNEICKTKIFPLLNISEKYINNVGNEIEFKPPVVIGGEIT